MALKEHFKLVRVYHKLKTLLDPNDVRRAEPRFFSNATIIKSSHPVSLFYASFGTEHTKVVTGSLRHVMNAFQSIEIDKKRLQTPVRDWGILNEMKANSACFGRGSETVFDKDIRDGLEIAADRIKIEADFGEKYNNECSDEDHELGLAKVLQPYAPLGKKFQPKLYKMHVYLKNGHFKKHRDTLHAKNHYATLVVSLTSSYEGGELVFDTDGESIKIKLGYEDFALFHTDVVHEVLPVTSEFPRVTLQYDVYLEDNENPSLDLIYEMDEEEHVPSSSFTFNMKKKLGAKPGSLDQLATEFLSHLKNFVATHPKDNVCFLLTHKYPLAMEESNLKGEDLFLYELLTKNGYNVKATFVRERLTYCDFNGCNRYALEVMTYKQHQLLFQEILHDDVPRTDEAEKDEESQKTYLFIGSSAEFEPAKDKSYIDYTGNEAEEGELVYVSLALAIEPSQINR